MSAYSSVPLAKSRSNSSISSVSSVQSFASMKSLAASVSSVGSSSTTSTTRERRKAVFLLYDEDDSEDEADYSVTVARQPTPSTSAVPPTKAMQVDVTSALKSGLKKSKKVLDLGTLVREVPAM